MISCSSSTSPPARTAGPGRRSRSLHSFAMTWRVVSGGGGCDWKLKPVAERVCHGPEYHAMRRVVAFTTGNTHCGRPTSRGGRNHYFLDSRGNNPYHALEA